jgi:hypothetical protein
MLADEQRQKKKSRKEPCAGKQVIVPKPSVYWGQRWTGFRGWSQVGRSDFTLPKSENQPDPLVPRALSRVCKEGGDVS